MGSSGRHRSSLGSRYHVEIFGEETKIICACACITIVEHVHTHTSVSNAKKIQRVGPKPIYVITFNIVNFTYIIYMHECVYDLTYR